jgi:hypothetical protein
MIDSKGWVRRGVAGDVYGYCASHSRYFWGLRLHLIATLHGLPVAFALTGAKADERQTLLDVLGADPDLIATRTGQTLIADKHYYGREFEHDLAHPGLRLLRPARKGEPAHPDQRFVKPLRQVIESIFDTGKGQLDLERHGGHTPTGVLSVAGTVASSASIAAIASPNRSTCDPPGLRAYFRAPPVPAAGAPWSATSTTSPRSPPCSAPPPGAAGAPRPSHARRTSLTPRADEPVGPRGSNRTRQAPRRHEAGLFRFRLSPDVQFSAVVDTAEFTRAHQRRDQSSVPCSTSWARPAGRRGGCVRVGGRTLTSA